MHCSPASVDEKVDRERVAAFPLAKYASEHWVDHAKFENVQSQIQDDLKHLFDPKRPHLRAWIWMRNVEGKYSQRLLRYYFDAKHPPPLKATSLYYAMFCELAKWLITTHAEDLNAKNFDDRTPLHVASQEGHGDAVHVLLDHGAHVNSLDWTGQIPYMSHRAREVSKSCSSSSIMGLP
ncbi:hypothetical protein BGY98DRAFT_288954 [Russula aff. rugulosa BPL654]|nr:hypothetical protein BGY98DRAFT_288954 [Russula aff. rugulosa BPL654]